MWILGRFLPLMIDHLISEDDNHWTHFIQLLEIVDIVFAPTIDSTPGYLEVLIEENLEDFVKPYSETVLPKMHYIIHIPRLLARYVRIYMCMNNILYYVVTCYNYIFLAPLVRYWTMCFETKHQYFKSLASCIGNFINITYSLALRQQSYQCYILSISSGFCSQYQKIGRGMYIATL